MIRVDHRTVRRRSFRHRPTALAVRISRCSCGRTVEQGEPVVLTPASVVREPDGAKVVDLSGAEWVCQQHEAVPA